MIPALGAGGPGFNPRHGPFCEHFLHFDFLLCCIWYRIVILYRICVETLIITLSGILGVYLLAGSSGLIRRPS